MRAALLLLVVLLGSAAPVGAESVPIAGRVTTADGEPAGDVTLELVPILPPDERGRLEIDGRTVPQPVALAASNSSGWWRLDAPEAGFWKVIVHAAGHGSYELSFEDDPLLEPILVPTLSLDVARTLRAAVVDPAGRPAAGAWILAAEARPQISQWPSLAWHRHLPTAFAGDDGEVGLAVSAGVEVELFAGHADWGESQPITTEADTVTLELTAAIRRTIEVRDGSGRPLGFVPLRLGSRFRPAAVTTDEDGRAVLAVPQGGARLVLALENGRTPEIALAARGTAEDGAEVVTVPDPILVAGTVLETESRLPVPGAWVYPQRVPWHRAVADEDGLFEIGVDSPRAGLRAAASGYLPESFPVGAAGVEKTLLLTPTLDLPGYVESPAGGPARGIEITAIPDASAVYEMSAAFSLPRRHAVSDDDGRFLLQRLAADAAYSVTADASGTAPARVRVRDLPATIEQGGVYLSLTTGATLAGAVVDARSAPVTGVELSLAPEADLGDSAASMLRRHGDGWSLDGGTDAEGDFELVGVPEGRFALKLKAPGFAPETISSIEVEPGTQRVDLGLIELTDGVEVAGTVVDLEGAVIAGAEVRFHPTITGMRSSREEDDRTITGADGRFAIVDRRDGELLDLVVERDGFARKEVPRVGVPGDEPLEIVLQPGIDLVGTVVDEAGAPVSRARVAVSREGGGRRSGLMGFGTWLAATLSDEGGRFVLENVEPTLVRLSAQHSDFLPSQIGEIQLAADREPDELEIVLGRGSTVEGRVLRSDGRPETDARVGVREDRGSHFRSVQTDGSGEYRLPTVEIGRQVIQATAGGGRSVSEEIDVQPGVNALDLVIPAGVDVAGRVLSDAGRPIAGAVVSVRQSLSFSRAPAASSNDDGSFTIEGVASGSVVLTAEHEDFAKATLPEPIVVGDAPVLGIEIRMGSGSDLVGRLLGLEERLLTGTSVTAFQTASPLWQQGNVDSDGSYRIRNLSAGSWKVSASTSDGRSTHGSVEIVGGQREATLDLEFAEGLELSGLLLRAGTPVAGASISVGGLDNSSNGWTQSDHEGRFGVRGLSAGRYRLTVSGPGGGLSHGQEIDLLRDTDVEIDLEGLSLRGTVTDEVGGSPVAGAVVALEAVDSLQETLWRRVGKQTSTDANGRYLFSDVPEGSYRLRVSKPRFASRTRSVEVGGPLGVDTVDLVLSAVEGLAVRLVSPTGSVPATVSYAVMDPFGSVVAGGREPVASSGRLHLSSVPDGDWTLLLRADGFATRSLRARAPDDEVVVELQAAAELFVRVTEVAEDGTTAATLRLLTPTGELHRTVDWGGSTRDSWRLYLGETGVGDLPPGSWIISVSTTDGRSWERTVSLAAGPNETVLFD